MAVLVEILDDYIEGEKDAPLKKVVVTAEADKDSNRVDIRFHFSDPSGNRVCEVTYAGVVTNPITLSSIAVAAATAYGLCLATRYVWATMGIVADTYKEVAESEKDAKFPAERVRHVVNRLPDKKKQFYEAAVTVAKGCVPAAVAGGLKDWLGL